LQNYFSLDRPTKTTKQLDNDQMTHGINTARYKLLSKCMPKVIAKQKTQEQEYAK